MPAKRSAMRKIKEVLRLKFEAKCVGSRTFRAAGGYPCPVFDEGALSLTWTRSGPLNHMSGGW
jgi:hypothetical protein